MPDGLDFEQPLLELEIRIAALQATDDPAHADEIARLQERLERQRQRTYAALTPCSARSWRGIPSVPTRATGASCSSRTSPSCTATASSATTRPSSAGSRASRASRWS